LAFDALGEIHSDEDDALLDPKNQASPEYDEIVEGRYGLTSKLHRWKRHLNPHGRVLLSEPIREAALWEALGRNFEKAGWRAQPHRLKDGFALILQHKT
jgi:hypothetical protein